MAASPSGVGFSIRSRDLRPTERKLAHLAEMTGDATVLMKRIGVAMEGSTLRRFRDQRAPDGTPWKPSARALRPSTSRRRQPDRFGYAKAGMTLIGKGRLRQSIASFADATQAKIGSNLIYARIHQLGGTIVPKGAEFLKFRTPDGAWHMVKKVVIPARPYLGVSEDDRQEIEHQVETYIGEGLHDR